MTETELFAAVHEYVDKCAGYDVSEHRVLAFVFREDARAKLLEAIREWAAADNAQLAVRYAALSETTKDLESQLAAYDKIVCGLKMLLAKAAVCDAYLSIVEGKAVDIGELREMNGKLVVAREVLRELQQKEPA